MGRYSRAGRHYESFSKCFNCLVGFMVMAIMGFVSIPPLLILNEGHTTELTHLKVEGRSDHTSATARSGKENMSPSDVSDFFSVLGATETSILHAKKHGVNRRNLGLNTSAVSNRSRHASGICLQGSAQIWPPRRGESGLILRTAKRKLVKPFLKGPQGLVGSEGENYGTTLPRP